MTTPPGPTSLDVDFADGLDTAAWTTSYLPAWSSRTAAAADWSVDAEGLHLRITPGHPRWCPDLHPAPLQVSAVQSGSWSGPVGSTAGQQPFLPGQTVREEQPARWAVTPFRGRVEVTCRAVLDGSSMFSAWMVGVEDVPERSGELCLVEVFGDSVGEGPGLEPTAALGSGVHPFRDADLREEFDAPATALDVAGWHTYALEWQPDGVTFLLDGRPHRHSTQSPGYPMQLILGLFAFPGRAPATDVVPELVVRRVVVTAP